MIRFTCNSCGREIGAPERYAGKKIRCPGCESPNRVPESAGKKPSSKERLFKFRCPNCNQKIGLTADYAGKTVRCAKCRHSLRIPQTKTESEPNSSAEDGVGGDEAFANDVSSDEILADKSLTDELLAAKASEPSIEKPLRPKPLEPEQVPSQEQAFDSRVYVQGISGAGTDSGASGTEKRLVRILIAIVAGFGYSLVGALVWVFLSSLLGGMFYFADFLVVAVISLGGFGLIAFIDERNAPIGLLAAVIGLCGAFSGKALIAKWVTIPAMRRTTDKIARMTEMMSTFSNNFGSRRAKFPKHPSDDELAQIVENKKSMFAMGCLHLAKEGEFEEDLVWEILAARASGKTPDEKVEEIEVASDKVDELLEDCSIDKQNKIARENYSTMVKGIFRIIPKMLKTEIGFRVAFVASFSLFDFLFFPLGMWSAYRLGCGLSEFS